MIASNSRKGTELLERVINISDYCSSTSIEEHEINIPEGKYIQESSYNSDKEYFVKCMSWEKNEREIYLHIH